MLDLYLKLMAFVKREEGQDLVEYALIIALVSIVLVLALGALSGSIQGVFETIGTTLNP